jgi:hypothetical protein
MNNWGGKRKGAGRPTTGRKTKTFYITEEEDKKLRAYLKELRVQRKAFSDPEKDVKKY